jgi:hypothetical protein
MRASNAGIFSAIPPPHPRQRGKSQQRPGDHEDNEDQDREANGFSISVTARGFATRSTHRRSIHAGA